MNPQPEKQLVAKLPQSRILCGARVAIDPWHAVRATLLVRGGKIETVIPGAEPPANAARLARVIDLKGHLVLPGLINAHDHLHFGIFPRLGHGPYPSWREWATEIYQPEEPPLSGLLAIPKDERLWWGILRNALAGVTTVCHHDDSHTLLTSDELPVKVHAKFGWAHSLDDGDWSDRYTQTPADWPFILHFAEGLDPKSRREAGKIGRKTKLNNRIVLVHAIGTSQRDWLKLRSAGVWIVWCPTSNLHILGRTLARDLLLSYPSIALGSDSPISAAGDLLDELQAARELLDIPSDLLYRMVTNRAARLLRLSAHEGTVSAGGVADLLIMRDKGRTPCESLATLQRGDLIAIMHEGEFTVASEEFYARQDETLRLSPSPIERHGLDWHVAAPPAGLKLRLAPPRQEPSCAALAEVTNQ